MVESVEISALYVALCDADFSLLWLQKNQAVKKSEKKKGETG